MSFKETIRKYWRYIVVSLALLVGIALLSQSVFASVGTVGKKSLPISKADVSNVAVVPIVPVDTDTPTDTPTYTNIPTNTPTSTPNPCDLAWSVVSSPNPGMLRNVLNDVEVVTTNDVWAVGYYGPNSGQTLIEHWNGTAWSVVSSPNVGSLFGVAAVSANDVWAVGSTCSSCSPSQTVIEHWDGISWSVVPNPNPGASANILNGITAVSANDVWAVGDYSNGGPYQTLIEHWDGTSWSVVPSSNPGTLANGLFGITAVSANDVWAVGSYRSTSSSPNHTLIEHWDGTSWSVVSSPNVGTNDNGLSRVAAASPNDVWAVGLCQGGQTLIEHWNGTAWSVVSSPNIGALNDVEAVTANDAWAVSGSTLTAHWDGSSWSVVSSSPSPSLCGYNNLNGIAAASPNDVWVVGINAYPYGSDGNVVYQTLVEHYTTVCSTPTSTPTNTPTPSTVIINGHLTWQGVAPANRPSVTGTLQLCVSGSSQTFPFSTDTGGNFTITTILPAGTYQWWIKGGRHISSSSPADGPELVINGGHATQEFGTQKGGNADASRNNNNIINDADFSAINQQFGHSGVLSGDFDYNLVVNTLDFNILKGNFGFPGHGLFCPCPQ